MGCNPSRQEICKRNLKREWVVIFMAWWDLINSYNKTRNNRDNVIMKLKCRWLTKIPFFFLFSFLNLIQSKQAKKWICLSYQQENKSKDYFRFESCFKRERAYFVIKTGSAYELILVQVRKKRVWDIAHDL